jgi:hypothetical protein
MRLRVVLVSACAVSLSLAMTGAAVAAPAPGDTQLPGTVLAKALLPASVFGAGWQAQDSSSTGRSLKSPRGQNSVATASCAQFQGYSFAGYGETAEADLYSADAATDQEVLQDVAQFASGGAARAFFAQVLLKYRECAFYVIPGLEGYFIVALLGRVHQTTVAGDPAFRTAQAIEFTDSPVFYQDTTIILAGTNVYEVARFTNANTPVPAWMPDRLIGRVQALYR